MADLYSIFQAKSVCYKLSALSANYSVQYGIKRKLLLNVSFGKMFLVETLANVLAIFGLEN